jgi:LytS/YehU family sensor histidine kinase
MVDHGGENNPTPGVGGGKGVGVFVGVMAGFDRRLFNLITDSICAITNL